jgi:FKBP-type peptidyl-prolyl cis-trans isomerase FkpA
MIKTLLKLFLAGLLTLLVSCAKEDGNFCDTPIINITEANATTLKEYVSEHFPNALLHSSGFYYTISADGKGKNPGECFNVVVNYEGLLTNGKVFDKASRASFNANDLIPGWKIGIPLIKEKGIITLILPPEHAYGSKGVQDIIPSNAITIFKIELLEILK